MYVASEVALLFLYYEMEVLFLLASLELQKAVQGYENYISQHGIDESLINAYVLASGTALTEEKDVKYGLKISNRAKSLISQFTTKNSIGDIWAVERFSRIWKPHRTIS